MINRKYIILTMILLLAASGLQAYEAVALHMKISRTREAAPPHIFEESVFFSFRPGSAVRYVGIAFAHENFREVHLFQRNERNVLFLLYPIPEGLHALDYRLVVDGLWTTDPSNPLRYRDASGVSLSRFELPPSIPANRTRSPVINRRDGTVEFNLAGPPGRTVFISGSFNGWDPFMHRFREVRPGLYSLSLRLLPGTYHYIFYSDGRRSPDPLNPDRGTDPEGYEVSVLHFNPQ